MLHCCHPIFLVFSAYQLQGHVTDPWIVTTDPTRMIAVRFQIYRQLSSLQNKIIFVTLFFLNIEETYLLIMNLPFKNAW